MQYTKNDKYLSERRAFVSIALCAVRKMQEGGKKLSFVHPSQETIMSPASTSLDLVHSLVDLC